MPGLKKIITLRHSIISHGRRCLILNFINTLAFLKSLWIKCRLNNFLGTFHSTEIQTILNVLECILNVHTFIHFCLLKTQNGMGDLEGVFCQTGKGTETFYIDLHGCLYMCQSQSNPCHMLIHVAGVWLGLTINLLVLRSPTHEKYKYHIMVKKFIRMYMFISSYVY